jgi:hypothetical protein
MKNTRMSTLVKKLGAPTASFKLSKDEYATAINEGRVLSIHHSDDGDGPDYGLVGHNVVNVDSRVVFPNPIPKNVEYVTGIKAEYLG